MAAIINHGGVGVHKHLEYQRLEVWHYKYDSKEKQTEFAIGIVLVSSTEIYLTPRTIRNFYGENKQVINVEFPIEQIGGPRWLLNGHYTKEDLLDWWNNVYYIETRTGNWLNKHTLLIE